MAETKRKYSKVVSTAKRTNLIGTVTYWVLTLDCGHTAESPYSKRAWRTRTKPAPVRVVCPTCEGERHG